jgi:hypothetical protein
MVRTVENDTEIYLKVDKDFNELVTIKAHEKLEEFYRFPAIVSG